jgi:Cys-rich repeat protein
MKQDNRTMLSSRPLLQGTLGLGFVLISLGLYASGCNVDEFFEINETKINNTVGTCDPNKLGDCPTCTSNDQCAGDECNDGFCEISIGECRQKAKEDGTVVETKEINECSQVVCKNGKKETANLTEGDTCLFTKTHICTGDGRCIECTKDEHCTTENRKHCANEECVECNDSNDCADGKKCDEGKCVQCTQNDHCGAGRFCDNSQCVNVMQKGEDCKADAQCASGHCYDGVCCLTECNKECWSCNLAPFSGYCSPVPQGDADDSCSAVSKAGCGLAKGQIMTSCQNGLLNENICQNDNDCLSTKCVPVGSGLEKCKQSGGICTADSECASQNCSANLCI